MKYLNEWEEQFKKGQLTLWTLPALSEKAKDTEEILEFTKEVSNGFYSFDTQSLYSALRNFITMGLIQSEEVHSPKGPPKKKFVITLSGRKLLVSFVNRNLSIFNSKKFLQIIKKAENEN